jgi:hypothetical protein
MSKLINLFTHSEKLDGSNNYKYWKRYMQNTLICNELQCDIFDSDTPPTKPSVAAPIAKLELRDEKALAFLQSFVNEHMFVHIKSSTNAWSTWNPFCKIFDTPTTSQRVDLQMKLLLSNIY